MSITYAIRKWAFLNARLAQGLIAVATLLLLFLGHLLGVLVESLGVDMYAIFLIGTGVTILAWTLAPRRGEDFPIRYTYARQKVAVVIMLTSMCVGLGSGAIYLEQFSDDFEKPSEVVQALKAAVGPKIFSKTSYVKSFDTGLSNWLRGGISKRVSKATKRILKFNLLKDLSADQAALLNILTFLLAIGLALLISMLSCSLSCSGYPGLSALLLLGCLGLVIFLFVKSLKKIRQNT